MPDIQKALGVIMFVTCTMLGSTSIAAQERWFTIELLIFKNGGTAWQQEDWDSNPELYYPEPLLISSALASSDEIDTPIIELEFDGALADAAAKLMATGQYRILYSRRWQQGLLKTKDAPNLLITGGNPHGSHYELEGSIKFSVERYLHANANLWFTTFGEPAQPESADAAEDGSDRQAKYNWLIDGVSAGDSEEDESKGEDSDAFDEDFSEDFEEPMTLPNPPWNSDYIGEQDSITRVVPLRQKRRMRSKETHYIDHPSIGILIRIEPVPDADYGED